MQQHFGIDVSDKVKEILTMCENEEDKKTIIKLCNALGLSY